jgi:hypothetical protein
MSIDFDVNASVPPLVSVECAIPPLSMFEELGRIKVATYDYYGGSKSPPPLYYAWC